LYIVFVCFFLYHLVMNKKVAGVSVRRVCIDGSHKWKREGSGDCGIRVVIEESGYQNQAGTAQSALAAYIMYLRFFGDVMIAHDRQE